MDRKPSLFRSPSELICRDQKDIDYSFFQVGGVDEDREQHSKGINAIDPDGDHVYDNDS